ncbi:LOW QUALITY PROTEIN: inactive serine/threonine-protein kinase PLK5 [Eptesicus fuscus]|uniref:LOW QUALITY PROTEIN: inactive serine/threonine-protein kinase PLK5 n=1 Tax=Eptesicus fuscus TaxID=29078 RepID=UPI002403FCCC|nr:LOW QUALITY PROTEIN: inactive serine/threonine-protein kinase PLK5 [Eptesicus fuscus]
MEPRPRRRRSCRQLVSAFLRDPGSGRVYKRGKLIGKGAFSRCYKLTDMSTSTVFALKVVPRGGPGVRSLRPFGKVEREIALHSRLRHRNIVAFHGHFADRDHVYLVLEYCSRKVHRQSLAHVLEVRQTLTEPEVRYYLRGLVSGLRYLHQQRIVHRDLKLSNFFLNKNMEVKIGDLGLAARVGPGGRCHRVLCGTPNFLAPEVVSRNGHSCQSDIWALGCIMYMVLTGDPPFVAASLSEMYKNIREGRYPEPAHLSPNACRLIARLLAPNPAERPSLDHLLQDNFFTQGFTPDRLPPHSCHSPPIFAVPQPLGRLFRKVGQLLMSQCQLPCPYTPHEAACPGEDGPNADFMEWGSEASLLERGALRPEVPVHLVTQGILQSDPAGSEGSPRQEVEAAIRNLQLCLNPGPPVTQDPAREQGPILWAPKWVDYSSKYGFGYRLLDGTSGVLSGWYPHGPASPRGEERLPVPTQPASPGLCLLRFLASQQALLLLFSDGAVQVSCSGDQVQLVLHGRPEELLLTVWERGRPAASYTPGILQSHGCPPAARQHLHHALRMLQSI